MDILAHALWAFILFPEGEYKFLAIIFAIIPDVFFSIPYLVYITGKGKLLSFLNYKKGIIPQLPKNLINGYKLLHSMPLVILLTIILFFFGLPKIIILYIFGSWFLHIAIDIFLHDEAYIKTPFLYPFSSFTIRGINWASPKFLIVNYILIIIALIIKFA